MFESKLNKGKANGYVPLGGYNKISKEYLSQDVFVTGGTYSSGTTIFTNNTGGTFSVTGFSTGSTGNGAAWYVENSTPPTTAPIASGTSSIAIGDSAQAKSNDMFVAGYTAGQEATSANDSNFLGQGAGSYATFADNSNFLGQAAGLQAEAANNSNFMGYYAGQLATNAINSNFIGNVAGYQATGASDSNFIGEQAGQAASNAYSSNMFGSMAGFNATNANNSNFIGNSAGNGAIYASNSNFIGQGAGAYSSGNTVNAFGPNAGQYNALNGMTIFANSSLPSYADRTAATTAISLANGASAGNTYLYYNQTTFAIEGVRL